MKATTVFCVAVAAAAFAGPASAVFKCTTARGVVYQDRPCRDGNESDVMIVIPTGEIAPRGGGMADDTFVQGGTRSDDRTPPARIPRNVADTKRAERKVGEPTATSADGTQRRSVPQVVEKVVPMTADDARKSDPSAKYYATEGFRAGSETPIQMNCESPNGERRTFYLSDGRLTSI